MKTGIELIADERQRQIEVEGWTKEHDAQHKDCELVKAAICYADPNIYYHQENRIMRYRIPNKFWPKQWDIHWFKPTDRIRDLVKAGALIAAEIDRLQGEVAVEIEEKPRIISSFVEKHPTNGIISITVNTSEKWVIYQINKVAARGFVNITMLSNSSECQERIEVPDFDANDYQMFSAQEKDQITIMCIPLAMIKECE